MQQALSVLLAIACSLGLTPDLAAHEKSEPSLGRHVTVAWQGQHLSTVLRRLSKTQGFFIWLDRRVDPQQTVEAHFSEVPIQHVLEQLAEKHSLGISVLDNLVYVGPTQSARELPTLLRRARAPLAKAPSSARRRWLTKEPATWPRLSQPRDLLTSMMEQAEVKLQGDEKIIHDLWSSKPLPRLALIDRAVLILIGFDLTCHISADGDSCEVVPIKRPVVLDRPSRISKNSSKEASKPSTHAKKRYSLQLKNQAVGGVIDQLADQLNLQIVWDQELRDDASRSQQTLVSCDMKDVPLDDLLSGILSPAGLTFRRDGKKIEITASP
ncbi:MAG: hypothetical protein GXP28_03850 [Planctomycetes bacterium]|nr:hypothetical protein [Planctomycetota bacterium]